MGRMRRSLVMLSTFAMIGVVALPASANHVGGSTGVVGGWEVDGNFVLDGAGTEDWATAAEVVRIDDPGNSDADSQFGGGSKEQEPDAWTFDVGSVPGKTDLTRV